MLTQKDIDKEISRKFYEDLYNRMDHGFSTQKVIDTKNSYTIEHFTAPREKQIVNEMQKRLTENQKFEDWIDLATKWLTEKCWSDKTERNKVRKSIDDAKTCIRLNDRHCRKIYLELCEILGGEQQVIDYLKNQ